MPIAPAEHRPIFPTDLGGSRRSWRSIGGIGGRETLVSGGYCDDWLGVLRTV